MNERIEPLASSKTMKALFLLLFIRSLFAFADDGCADVIAATAMVQSTGTWTFTATVASHETGWEKYADEWEVRASGSATKVVLGTRVLLHPHVNEQPFTRSLSGVVIPDNITSVVVAARDSLLGYCGEEFFLELPGRNTTGNDAPPSLSPVAQISSGDLTNISPASTSSSVEGAPTSSSLFREPLMCAVLSLLSTFAPL